MKFLFIHPKNEKHKNKLYEQLALFLSHMPSLGAELVSIEIREAGDVWIELDRDIKLSKKRFEHFSILSEEQALNVADYRKDLD